jgi:membrane associated rhomboid family serine protease
MDTLSIAKTITRAILATLVFAVIGFSLLLAPEINSTQILFALGKGFLTFAFGWIFILILSDTLVKSIASSAMEAHVSRKDGGMLYHFLKPEPGEVVEDGKAPKPAVESSK